MPVEDSPSRLERQTFGNDMLDLIVEWIGNNLNPEQVFSNEKLDQWAETHGWIQEV